MVLDYRYTVEYLLAALNVNATVGMGVGMQQSWVRLHCSILPQCGTEAQQCYSVEYKYEPN